MEPGIALWEGTLDLLSPMNLNIISTFILGKQPFCYLKLVEIHYKEQIIYYAILIHHI
jgi:hypothetical protein